MAALVGQMQTDNPIGSSGASTLSGRPPASFDDPADNEASRRALLAAAAGVWALPRLTTDNNRLVSFPQLTPANKYLVTIPRAVPSQHPAMEEWRVVTSSLKRISCFTKISS